MEQGEQQHLTVKTSIRDLIENEDIIANIEAHVRYMHHLVTHAYAFCKFVFLDQFIADNRFDISVYLNHEFFYRVILSLGGHLLSGGTHPLEVTAAHELFDPYLPHYRNYAQFNITHVSYLDNAASYEAMRMVVAYDNTVRNNFGKLLRRTVNTLLQINQRKDDLRAEMEFESDAYINEQIRLQITQPAAVFKDIIRRNNLQEINQLINEHFPGEAAVPYREALQAIQQLLVYEDGYAFEQNNIYYDCKSRPQNHFRSYFLMCQYFRNLEQKAYKCFPLRTSLIPCYTTIDLTTLARVILRLDIALEFNDEELIEYCYPGARSARKRIRNDQQIYEFRGTILTDGVGVSVLNSRRGAAQGGIRGIYRPERNDQEFRTLTQLTDNQRQELGTDVAFFDPGRQDLLYGIHHDSRPDRKIKYRYTRSNRAKVTGMKSARNQRDNIPEHIMDVYHVREAFEILNSEISSDLDMEHFLHYLTAKTDPRVQDLYRFFADYTVQGRTYPLHRKLRLASYFAKIKEQRFLADSIRDNLRTNNLVIGNWSASSSIQRYHEPIQSVGLLRMLQQQQFNVILIDEYCTSTFCPDCGERVDKATFCLKGRPYQRANYPFTRCHGLLQCNSEGCEVIINEDEKKKLWNRDMLAVLNFRLIFDQLRGNGTIPQRFVRGNQ